MRRQYLNQLVSQGLKIAGISCVGTYLLQIGLPHFGWLFFLNLTLLFWLTIAQLALIFGFITSEDDP
ncbi:MAG: hypothetical protein AAF629_00210 [Chloroflexota bacterium]